MKGLTENHKELFKRMNIKYEKVMCPSTFIVGTYRINITKLDDLLDQNDKDYDSVKCTYKGKEGYSMVKYIEEVFNTNAVKLIEELF